MSREGVVERISVDIDLFGDRADRMFSGRIHVFDVLAVDFIEGGCTLEDSGLVQDIGVDRFIFVAVHHVDDDLLVFFVVSGGNIQVGDFRVAQIVGLAVAIGLQGCAFAVIGKSLQRIEDGLIP